MNVLLAHCSRLAPRLASRASVALLVTLAACSSGSGSDAEESTSPITDDSGDTSLGQSIAACTPHTPSGAAPVIFEAPSPIAPGQTALLYGARVGNGARVTGFRLPDDAPGVPPGLPECVPANATALEVVDLSPLSAKAVIPTSWTAGLYSLAVSNSSGAGAPVVLNRPRIDWTRGGPGGALVAGASFDVYGRSFGAAPKGWLVDSGGHATALGGGSKSGAANTDGYATSFTVPSSMKSGAHALYVHSGKGSRWGFSAPLPVSVTAPTSWPSKVYTITPSSDDDKELASAIAQVTSGGGGVIAFAKGSYTLTKGVFLPKKTVLRSVSGDRADVTITFDEPISPFPFDFAGYGDFTVEGITVESSTAARLFQCPAGNDFMRDPRAGAPQYQPDAPCRTRRCTMSTSSSPRCATSRAPRRS